MYIYIYIIVTCVCIYIYIHTYIYIYIYIYISGLVHDLLDEAVVTLLLRHGQRARPPSHQSILT